MATAQQQTESDPRIPTVASSWDKKVLEYLDVEYKKNECTEFKFDELRMSSELKDGVSPIYFSWLIVEIAQIAAEVEKVNEGKEITSTFEFNSDHHPSLIRFESMLPRLIVHSRTR